MMAALNQAALTLFYHQLRARYGAPDPTRAAHLRALVRQFGYLPYSYARALRELTTEETIAVLEEKFTANRVWDGARFHFDALSPVLRAGFRDAGWLTREQHTLKLTNLLALGDRAAGEPVHFVDWLKYLLVMPAGNPQAGVLAATLYLLPFQERDLGSAYIPHSSAVDPRLADPALAAWSAEEQVRFFLAFCQLAGHPLMLDVLPQMGRFSRLLLARPHLARWFDLTALDDALRLAIQQISDAWHPQPPRSAAAALVRLELDRLNGIFRPAPVELKPWLGSFQARLMAEKRRLSTEMTAFEAQSKLQQRVRELVAGVQGWGGVRPDAAEVEITRQGEIIAALQARGLWTAPGGAWCSTGAPVYDGMSQGREYPLFRHFDAAGCDVTDQANLDCLTPFYFTDWHSGELNQPVVDFYLDYLQEWQARFNFDAFRYDHVDHVIDAVSLDGRGRPASYRIPGEVLAAANRRMKANLPHFGALAEYMLWDRLYSQYHQEMGFDLLWGDDMLRQAGKGPLEVLHDNQELERYNAGASGHLAILKTYNNQDGEFGLINQYPGQLTRAGALYKYLLLRFLPGGRQAQRPLLLVDGDESFTPAGIAGTIACECTLQRGADEAFFAQFDALGRFALTHPALLEGQTELVCWEGRERLAAWLISAPAAPQSPVLLVIANPQYPLWIEREGETFIERRGQALWDTTFWLPNGLQAVAEYHYSSERQAYMPDLLEVPAGRLYFERLEPAEFHIYQVSAAR